MKVFYLLVVIRRCISDIYIYIFVDYNKINNKYEYDKKNSRLFITENKFTNISYIFNT